MKTKLLKILSMLLLFSSCTESNKIKNDLTRGNLKGKVNFIKETPYEAIENFGEVIKGDIYIDAGYLPNDYLLIMSSIKYKMYNEKGFEAEIKDFDANGKTLKRIVFNFDEKGKPIELKSYNTKNLEFKVTYKYDISGNNTESESYKANGELWYKNTYKYDEMGNKIEENAYGSNGSLASKYVRKYDKKSNLLEEVMVYDSEGELSEKNTYKNDEKGNVMEFKRYGLNGELEYKSTYKYDEKGNAIEDNEYNRNGELERTKSFKYKYDNKGNWIEKIEYENGNPKIISEREIEYYK